MAINQNLQSRSNGVCELCGAEDSSLSAFPVPPRIADSDDDTVVLCTKCLEGIQSNDFSDTSHWRSLTGSVWSEVPAVKVLAYKVLGKLSTEDWAAEARDGAYLEESEIAWAEAEDELEASKVVHKDSYGVVLEGGDTVILTENLNVKGTSFSAPKGTIVRKIRLVPDNAGQIEGKINGETIVILTKFVRKSAS
ncbi:MAG: PhnA protein [Sphingobacteriales bacterium]|nr:MAG: PhnA protein [Sphingobacteriales bacterium]